MLVGEQHKVESDSLNITLYRKEVAKKDRAVRWRPVAYFGTLVKALRHLVDLEVMETGLKDFRAVCKKQDELYALIENLKIPEKC